MARSSQKRKDLFDTPAAAPKSKAKGQSQPKAYSAQDIEILKGLEPVRRRPGMYIGGTDEKALHHLFAEVLDNSMDEAVAGHAKIIKVSLAETGVLTVEDDGRGIPVDPHPDPEYKKKSALEVIMTVLHAGGKFSGKNYETSGGLHGVGVSVVNALSERLDVEVARDGQLYSQSFERGHPVTKLKKLGKAPRRHGTTVSFRPDAQIFGVKARFRPARLYRMARSKAYLFAGVKIVWHCDAACLGDDDKTPTDDTLHFPGGLADFLAETRDGHTKVTETFFAGKSEKQEGHGRVEWAVGWFADADAFSNSYCNTIPTVEGGTHETGLRNALTKGLKAYGDLTNNKRAQTITADDVMGSAGSLLSVFIREPEFQGQTKEKLASAEAGRLVETTVRHHFEHWLTSSPREADKLLTWTVERAEERLRRRQEKEVSRKSALRKLRLPGKLADCSRQGATGTELFIVEGDSAGGSAKQARDRTTQAILPLRGKILNVASAGAGKLQANQELSDLLQALGCGTRDRYTQDDLRYEKIIIMTDADVDGAHIASLLITFFYREIPGLIRDGRLYLALPPLYKLAHSGKSVYARDDAHKDELLKKEFKANAKVEISRFKGLGEMMPAQLKETTMRPGHRSLLRVVVPENEAKETGTLVEQLMGRKAELRFQYIQENASLVTDLDI